MAIEKTTKDMLSMLPSWMDIQSEESIGAKFLNVQGKKIKELEDYVKHEISDTHIGTTDVADIDIIYKTVIAPEVLELTNIYIMGYVITGSGVVSNIVAEAASVADFYSNDGTIHKAVIDTGKRLCYLRQRYDYIIINGAEHSEILLHHVWNCFDEFGLLVGCPRLFGETNLEYKQRILDVFKKPGAADKQSLINAISREFGIPSTDIEVNSLADPAFKGSLLNSDGSPTDRLIGYAKKVNEIMSLTWGEVSWDKGYWASVNQDNIGLDYLPHVWDASTDGWSESDFQSGIGWKDDLYVESPKRTKDTQDFKYHVGLAGIKYEQSEVYPPHSFKFKLTGKGTIVSEAIVPEEYYYTVVAAPKIPLIFRVKAEKDYEQNPTTTFSGYAGIANESDLGTLTQTQKDLYYITSDTSKIEIVDATKVPNPPRQFVEIKVDMQPTDDGTQTPTVNDITLTWTATGDIQKSVKIDTLSTVSQNGNNYTVGFTSNTWEDVGALIKVQNDDVNLDFTPDGSMTLGKGEYYKMIDTEGDWSRSDMLTNVTITGDGDLKLSI